MECTKVNCPMQAGTLTDNCGENCPWRTTAKISDLISKAAAIDAIDCGRKLLIERNQLGAEHVVVHHARRLIEQLPAVDVAPVVHGEWEPSNDYNGYCCCSVCHDTYIDPDWIKGGKWQYCPHCGAKMDGESDG